MYFSHRVLPQHMQELWIRSLTQGGRKEGMKEGEEK
jgi:hypothetical protein